MINIDETQTFAYSLTITDQKCSQLKTLIDDILSDFEIARNLSKHTGNIAIINRLQDELREIKNKIEDFQEDELSLIILKLIDDDGNEVVDNNFYKRDRQIKNGSKKAMLHSYESL